MVAIKEEMRPLSLQYVNRLSDWIFVLTRWTSARLGEDETLWTPREERGWYSRYDSSPKCQHLGGI